MTDTGRVHPETGHTVTGVPRRPPAHAARPRSAPGWPSLLAAVLVLTAASVAVVLAIGADSVPGTPPSARTITATSAPPPAP